MFVIFQPEKLFRLFVQAQLIFDTTDLLASTSVPEIVGSEPVNRIFDKKEIEWLDSNTIFHTCIFPSWFEWLEQGFFGREKNRNAQKKLTCVGPAWPVACIDFGARGHVLL